ncbi:acyltransferase [Synechococcus sp. Cruz-9H2]|uniref:acyltransferase family protein n=1 Tax=unclassified Synechococcus TaxID=2626047 RepID=UPI0020CFE0FC|nr:MULTISPECIES: acyltransferase family protein [unclassified Synechococcus]MCP9819459.1 acyltransferase [Synechococcus sp. Cruz-9H2]MCP9855879.1 acyltransferase [Synechococcus sp. Cruz-9C9]MCP9870514.1 acyltransferase [Synechococcus sp. Cruz-7B9]
MVSLALQQPQPCDRTIQAAAPARWIEGLELARAAATFLVLWVHGIDLLPEPWRPYANPAFLRPGWWGVRIFFAMSGYLIGREVLQVILRHSRKGSVTFLLRRWLRTVPTYWMVLAALVVLQPGRWAGEVVWRNALFLHSLTSVEPSLLEVAWSLVIEEWSYLILGVIGLVVVGLWRRPPDRRVVLWISTAVVVAVIVISMAVRLRYVAGPDPSWGVLKKVLTLQLDSLAYGALLALAAAAAPALFQRLSQGTWRYLAACLAVMMLFSLVLRQQGDLGWISETLGWQCLAVLGYPLSGLLSCWFLLALWPFSFTMLWAPLVLPIRTLSTVSYSLYLLHLPLHHWFVGPAPGLAPFLAYLAVSIGLSWLAWWVLEKPFLSLRRYLR